MRPLRPIAVCLLVAFACLAADAAADAPEVTALQRLFGTAPLTASLFTPEFLDKVPVSDVQSYIASYKERLGVPTAIARDGTDWALASPNGSIKVKLALDSRGRIASLLFHDELSGDNQAALQRVLAATTISPDWFEPSYLDDVPTAKLESLLADLHARLGAFVRVETRAGRYFAIFEKGETHAQISADPDGKIDYLAFSKD
jgi:hypothetical protein